MNSEEAVPCGHHKQSILNQIVHGIDDEEEKAPESANDYLDDDLHSDFFDELEHIPSPFSSWLTKIVEEADRAVAVADDGQYDNVMYNEGFAKDFIRLCKLLPLWSAISCDIFDISEDTFSSANVECEFKNLKQALNDIIPCSMDTFVQEHIELINGQILEASQNENYIKFIGGHKLSDLESFNSSNEHPNESIDMSTEDESTTENNSNAQTVVSNECPACKNNDQPDGAHVCIECSRSVHALAGCSLSCGDKEGHGERRICMSCSNKARTVNRNRNVSQTAEEMNYTEGWDKSRKKSTSKYLRTAPNWHLNTNIKKKVNIGILQNGNICKTTHKVRGKGSVGLKNTCAFDSICQVSSLYFICN